MSAFSSILSRDAAIIRWEDGGFEACPARRGCPVHDLPAGDLEGAADSQDLESRRVLPAAEEKVVPAAAGCIPKGALLKPALLLGSEAAAPEDPVLGPIVGRAGQGRCGTCDLYALAALRWGHAAAG